jgi:hypothetical protein
MKINIGDEWANSNYEFENGDGTRYTVHVMPAKYGGLYVIVNESSLWRWHGNNDIKHLCGLNNSYTKKAVSQIMNYHDSRMAQIALLAGSDEE